VLLHTTDRLIPALSVSTPAPKYNPQDKIILTGGVVAVSGEVSAAWSSSIGGLEGLASTQLSRQIAGAGVFQLSLKAGTLTAGLSYR
ncbi:hypothetical protein B484DRAFT_393578, partial [Ochromonadaceae sp. CCMP2298]